MAGLVTTTSRNGSGSGYAGGNPTFRRFTSTQTIQKPLGCTIIVMECIGAGGGGGGGAGNSGGNDNGGGPGGGGAIARGSYPAESLPNTFTITVANGGAAGAGGSSGAGAAGSAAGPSSVTGTDFILKAWGGGLGGGGQNGYNGGGGGGGGTGAVGANASTGAGQISAASGGNPTIQS